MVRLPVIEVDMVGTPPFFVDVFFVFFSYLRRTHPQNHDSDETIDCFSQIRMILQVSEDLTPVYAVSMPYFLRQVHRSNPAARSISVNFFG